MMTTVFMGQLVLMTCPVVGCGVPYGLEADYRQRRLDGGGSWSCPNGHSVHFTTPEVVRLRNELERAQRAAIEAREQRDAQRVISRNAHAQTKREITKRHKIEARIANGVCPHCHRHFTNVERHMASKHADASTR
jgi:hypothetical protein